MEEVAARGVREWESPSGDGAWRKRRLLLCSQEHLLQLRWGVEEEAAAIRVARMPTPAGALSSAWRGRGQQVGREAALVAPPFAYHSTVVFCFYGVQVFTMSIPGCEYPHFSLFRLSPHS